MMSQGNFIHDDIQLEAINRLDIIQQELMVRYHSSHYIPKWWFGRLSKFMKQEKSNSKVPVRGLYMWGGVGRGKTWIMDLFFQSMPGNRKLRLHFHRFMMYVHQELSQLQGKSDPLLIVADRFKAKIDILCFDELFVSDITDAMLLGTLMEALFVRGISLVATSNIPPDDLYRNGLQRARFMSVIEQIKHHCDIMNVDAGNDYRLRKLTSTHLWNYPLNEKTNAEMRRMFYLLSSKQHEETRVLEINHRQVPIRNLNEYVLAIDFLILCGDGRSQHDYIEVSRRFRNVLLYDVPVMMYKTEDQARRFLMLVDEFYERHVKLIVSAEASLFDIYQGTRLIFEYQRCLSRLQEMQSEEYLRLPHLP